MRYYHILHPTEMHPTEMKIPDSTLLLHIKFEEKRVGCMANDHISFVSWLIEYGLYPQ